MYAIQIFQDRKYVTVSMPKSLTGGFDNYASKIRSAAEGTMVRFVVLEKSRSGLKPGRVLRKGKATGQTLLSTFKPEIKAS